METDVKKSIIFYLKNSERTSVHLSEKEFYENFLFPYTKMIMNLSFFEDKFLNSNDFSELNQLSKFSLYVFNPKLGQKKKFKISNKKDKIIFSSRIQSFGTGEIGKILRFVFNDDGSLFFRIKSKTMIKFGIVDPAGKYINVFCKDNEGYFHNLSYSKNTVASYKYDNDKKIMETKNFYNKAFKSYRTLIFDLSSGEPVESRVSFLNGNYSLIQEIGSDYFVNINKNPDERNSEEKFIGEFIDFVLESKEDFLSSINNDDKLLFDLCFPSENEKTVEIPF